MDIKLTKEEHKLMIHYKNEKFYSINQLLSNDIEKENPAEYTKENVQENLELIQKIYEIMVRILSWTRVRKEIFL